MPLALSQHGLEPAGFGARVQQRRAVTVVGQLLDPGADLIAVERRVQINTADPRLDKPSSASVKLRAAHSHGRGSAAQGSRSNGPIASMIHFGVQWVCDRPTDDW